MPGNARLKTALRANKSFRCDQSLSHQPGAAGLRPPPSGTRCSSRLHHRPNRAARRQAGRLERMIREQAMLRPLPAFTLGPGSALTPELRVHGTPGGIRTRDLSFNRRSNSDLHHGSAQLVGGPRIDAKRVGGERAILLLPVRAERVTWHCSRRALNPAPPRTWRPTEVTDIFTTAISLLRTNNE